MVISYLATLSLPHQTAGALISRFLRSPVTLEAAIQRRSRASWPCPKAKPFTAKVAVSTTSRGSAASTEEFVPRDKARVAKTAQASRRTAPTHLGGASTRSVSAKSTEMPGVLVRSRTALCTTAMVAASIRRETSSTCKLTESVTLRRAKVVATYSESF